MGVNPYAYYYEDAAPGIAAMRAYNEKAHPDVKYRPNSYIQGWFTGMVYVEAVRRVVAVGQAGHRREPDGRRSTPSRTGTPAGSPARSPS